MSKYITVLKIHSKTPLKPMGRKTPKPPIPLGHVDRHHSNTPRPAPTPLTSHHPKRQLDCLMHFYTTMQQIPIGVGCPKFTQNCPLPFDDLHPYVIHPSLDRRHLLLQMAPRSNQPLFHNSPTSQTERPTNRQTNGWDRRQARSNTRLHSIVCIVTQLINNKSSSK